MLSIFAYLLIIFVPGFAILFGFIILKTKNVQLALIFGNIPIVAFWLIYLFSGDTLGEYSWMLYILIPGTILFSVFDFIRLRNETSKSKITEMDKMNISDL